MDQSPKPPLVYNVVDYGAIGNGVATDTVAVQAAITAASTTGGIVFFPQGTFLLGSLHLTSVANIDFRGVGDASILKLNSNPTQNIQNITTWLLLTSCTGCSVEKIQFDLNNREHCAIGCTGCTDIRIESNYIHNSPGTIGDNRPAIVVHSTVGARVLNNYINDVSAWFYFGLGTTLGQITDSVFSHNICRNAKSTNGANCTRSIISDNIFDTCLYAGIEAAGVGTAMVDWVISNNTFKSCTAPALQIAALSAGALTSNGVITGNTFSGNLDACIECFGDVQSVTISDNIVRDSAKGILLTVGAGGGCKRISVTGNQCYDTRSGGSRTMTVGIQLDLGTSASGAISGEALTDIDITDNIIRNTTDIGLELSWTSGTASLARVKIEDNSIFTCANYGMSIGVGNPVGLWSSMSCQRNTCIGSGSGEIRLSIDSGDINTWIFRDNVKANAIGSPYIIGGSSGVPAFFGMRSTGSPESAIVGGIGSTYTNMTGGVGTTWYVKETGTGNTGWTASFGGATSSTDNAAARFDGVTGKLQNSGVIIDDSNNVTGIAALTASASALVGATTLNADVPGAFATVVMAMVGNNNNGDAFVSIGNGNNAVGPHIYGAKTRSTGTDANTPVQSGDQLIAIGAYGASPNGDYRLGGLLTCTVDGAPSGTIIAGKWDLYTKDASGTLAIRATVDKDGVITFTCATEASAIGAASQVITGGQSIAKRSFLGTIGSTFKGNVLAGVQDGTVAVSGQVGEVLSSTVSTYTNFTTTVTYQQIATITLTKGDWVIEAFFTYDVNAATITTGGNAIFVIGTTTASAAGCTEGLDICYIDQNLLTGDRHSGCIVGKQINVASDTPYYLNGQASFTLGNPRFVGSLLARRLR